MTARTLIWDAHSNLPLSPGRDIQDVALHCRLGFDFVSLNVGYDPAHIEDIIAAVAWYRAAFARHPDQFQLVGGVADLMAARARGVLAVAFDLEGALCLFERPEMVRFWADLGVRQMHLAYNRNNSVAGGCYDPDMRLGALGRSIVAAMNEAGVIVDCSHGGRLCTLDIMDASEKPVVFSHANAASLVDLPRNVTDEQIRACARTGGVIGITGYSRFLGAIPSRAADMARHIDHVAQLVGIAHVGIGWDYGYPDHGVPRMRDETDFDWWFPDAAIARAMNLTEAEKVTPLQEIRALPDALARLGYSDADVRAVLGGNFLRVATETWPA